MKKIFSLILVLALLLSVGVPTAYACGGRHGSHHAAPKVQQKDACNFVDADKDGICDNCDGSCKNAPVDENKDGVCDHCGEKCDDHRTDADGDGVCDNCGKACDGHGRHNRCNNANKSAHHGGHRGERHSK